MVPFIYSFISFSNVHDFQRYDLGFVFVGFIPRYFIVLILPKNKIFNCFPAVLFVYLNVTDSFVFFIYFDFAKFHTKF